LTLTGSLARQDVLDADVFVELRPVDTLTTADETPVVLLLGCSVEKPGVPHDGHRNRATVHEIDGQGVLAQCDVAGSCRLDFKR